MRPQSKARRVAAGALAIGTVTGPVLLAAQVTGAATTVPLKIRDRSLALGQPLVAQGKLTPDSAGRRIVLELAAPRGAWHGVRAGRVGPHGGYKLKTRVRRSVRVRVRLTPTVQTRATAAAGGGAGATASAAQKVSVRAQLKVARRERHQLAGAHGRVGGHVYPARRGRRVVLDVRRHGKWRALARTRTGRRGGFSLRYRATQLGDRPLRVRFTGDRVNAASRTRAGRLMVFRESVASWYSDYGAIACARRAPNGLGVANLSLPCGTKVMIRYHGRQTAAWVDDRGPYVGGREWDLGSAVRARLGFDGVGTVWTTR